MTLGSDDSRAYASATARLHPLYFACLKVGGASLGVVGVGRLFGQVVESAAGH